MKPISLSILALLFAGKSFAQPANIFATINDYRLKKNTTSYIEIKTHKDLGSPGDVDFSIEDNHKIPLKKRALAIERNDSLYINCSVIGYKWFTPVLYKNDRYIYFRSYMSRLKEHEIQMHVAGRKRVSRSELASTGSNAFVRSSYFGGVGAAVAVAASESAKEASKRYNYVIDLADGRVKVIDIPLMQEILAHKPLLDLQYMREGHPEDMASIVWFLTAAAEK